MNGSQLRLLPASWNFCCPHQPEQLAVAIKLELGASVRTFQTIISGCLLVVMAFCGARSEAQETHLQKAKNNVALKQVNNVKADNKELEQFTVPPPITGFHPIKKIVQPIKNLEDTSEKLDQQATKLEQPLSTLRQPILDVQHGMTHVDKRVTAMQGEICGTQKQVKGVRADIAAVRKDIQGLKGPVVALQEPMEKVAGPLEAVKKQLHIVLLAIFIGSLATAFGIPLTFVILWKYRAKFFPGLSHEHITHHLQNTFPSKV